MGQVQSRQQDESYFKLDAKDKDAVIKKYTELASSAKGGKVLEASDELFGEGFHLIKDGPAIEDKNRETANGFWKDGWETRRHNKDTHHTAIIQLAFAGTIAGFDIDTSFFDGSHPSYASVEGCLIVKGVKDSYEWKEILPKVPLNGNSHHFYGIQASDEVYTHLKLNMYPDGGIARLRVYGNVSPIFPEEKTVFDLASMANGGRVIKTSDDRYGKPANIILPTSGVNTRDGWQTRRSRVKGHHDWVEIKLGATGLLESLEVDTTHFCGNNPDFVSLDACKSEYNDVQYDPEVQWVSLLNKSEVHADKKNIFDLEQTGDSYTHVRLNIFPDGGISRLRVYGLRVPEAVETVEVELVEETVVETVDELKVVETKETVAPLTEAALSTSSGKTNETLVETEVDLKNGDKVILTSEVSSVTTLIEEETTEPAKKSPAKRGRPKGSAAATAVLAATKLTPKKKAKGRSASVLDDEEADATEAVASGSPRNKRVRE
ncbi:MAG: galactose-binding domain-like protein [Linnemannia elongata]|nr:MAG: galactose-binding domain-like protein [Linnemannia elongata]